jgi:hypothetical protein
MCGAAQAETPDGYANRGAYVSEVAKDDHGHASDTADATAKGDSHGKGHGKGHNG